MSTPAKAGPPAPGELDPGPFTKAKAAQPIVAGSRAPGAWKALTDALGRDLQGGLHRAHTATRNLRRLR